MSAIAGVYNRAGNFVDIEHGSILMEALQIYPADAICTWYEDNIFLGCHSQWITPESITEQLPYYDSIRQLAITSDAIIDNRQQLFENLQVQPGQRTNMSDSELILLTYAKWGEAAPKYLVGDFAFMIWDGRERKLFGARDFSGSRTLYFVNRKRQFAFCTVIEPLLALPDMKRELNKSWLAEYLAITGMVDVVSDSSTVYKDIEQVPPSHSISITGDQVKLKRYCTISMEDQQLQLKSNEEYVEAFREVFQEAVTSRLRTHRHVGAQLSGGLDSGAVVSFAVNALRKNNQSLHTFSYIPSQDFKNYLPKRYLANESPFIQSTIEYVGSINEHYCDFADRNSLSEVDDFLKIMEMPYKFFENSFWLKGMFEKASIEGVGVLLNGGRGNMSISWGPAIDYYAVLLKKLKWAQLTRELHHYSHNAGGSRLRRLPEITRVAFPFLDRMFPEGEPYQYPTLINPEFAKRMGVFEKLKEYGIDRSGWSAEMNAYEQRKKHFEDLFHWNASNTLATKLSLRYSLWKRDPTNDIRVIRFCLSVPEGQYVQNGLDRALVRRATENYLPDKVRLNQRIRGAQGVDWVHRMIPHWNAFIEEIQQLSTDPLAMEIFNGPVILAALTKAQMGAKPEQANDPDYRILMRSLIVYRFLKGLE
ncbi:asparagine synthase (glutamine-hydrolysing) [Paenibacillus sp. 1_12]|uniref:lasso peptide isopeptide bond-forming cyclase n=1 Tax=Paenibacillus sp. 1_12 TaxID=1566278 RepID=UPI0008EEA1C7|nr:lasso peptide isopeptide bond-forming cyclase [Paenibacillus sp. 1_12]SFL15853.1 asparagine synthase (glutamine-hydrolysing) [Paenibacillus sp. 1_12]